MLVEHKIALEEINLILRYVVQRARLTATQQAVVRGFLLDKKACETAAEVGITHQGVRQARVAAFNKMRREFGKLGVVSATELLGETDERPAEPPVGEPVDRPAVYRRRKSFRDASWRYRGKRGQKADFAS